MSVWPALLTSRRDPRYAAALGTACFMALGGPYVTLSFKLIFLATVRHISSSPVYGEIYKAMADVAVQSEACIDGVWMGVDLLASPELQAVRGLPTKNLGEGLMASETVNDPSQEWHSESMPRFAPRGMTMLRWLAPAMYQRINVGILRQYALGRKIIEEAGGIEAYNQRARKKWGPTSRITELEHDKAIVFEE